MDIAPVRDYFTGLQDRIVGELEGVEGRPFLHDAWDRPQGGGGISRLIEDGALFERGGVNFSHVKGEQMPASATAHRPELAGRRWEAMVKPARKLGNYGTSAFRAPSRDEVHQLAAAAAAASKTTTISIERGSAKATICSGPMPRLIK
jgi:hypothetical protein